MPPRYSPSSLSLSCYIRVHAQTPFIRFRWELSADAPMRPPYTVYLQGGLTFESGKLGVLLAAEELLRA